MTTYVYVRSCSIGTLGRLTYPEAEELYRLLEAILDRPDGVTVMTLTGPLMRLECCQEAP